MHMGLLDKGAPVGIVATPTAAPESPYKVVARHGFWDLPGSYINTIAKDRDCPVKGSLLERLAALIQHEIGPLDEEALLAILTLRLVPTMQWDTSWMEFQPSGRSLTRTCCRALRTALSLPLSPLVGFGGCLDTRLFSFLNVICL